MAAISIFDMFKVGVGPSSSHTMGPWLAAESFLREFEREGGVLTDVNLVEAELFGSLAKTGAGHGTDVAILMGWTGANIESFSTDALFPAVDKIKVSKEIRLLGKVAVPYEININATNIGLEHPNTMGFALHLQNGETYHRTYFSLGGGFILQQGALSTNVDSANLPHPIETAEELIFWCEKEAKTLAEISLLNESHWRSEQEVRQRLRTIWDVMAQSIFTGCHSPGILPGGLSVQRRAATMNQKLVDTQHSDGFDAWLAQVKTSANDMESVTRWVSCFALAVNEVNASYGRIVTAPTNGAAGVIPAVLMQYLCFGNNVSQDTIFDFLLVAGEIGCLFKKGATISAAEGGCQAEIGVSAAMAAAGLAHCSGATTRQVLMAAEIAMEHHLGLTCDPVGGLVQIPCIERNAMGAMKAITAAQVALHSDPLLARVSLDDVIATMWRTAQDMRTSYKETAEGGLALLISIDTPEC